MMDSGASITFSTVLNLALAGWFLITGYSGWRFANFIINQLKARDKTDNEQREKFFEILNNAQDIKDRIKMLERDINRNINKIHDMGKESGYYDRTNKPGVT